MSRPWDLIVQQPDQTLRPLPPGQAMGTTFDELGQALLILGAPGAGKTTLLLELARDLLDRAEQDTNHPMPVVFHLSSWAKRQRPLADWLVDELNQRYYVPRKLARAWSEANQILPLLDGLDEVAPEHRAACVEAINRFRRQHGRVPLAVCCRVADYEALPTRVELFGAIVIQPLSREQIRTYLKQAGKALAGVRTVLQDDEMLWELLQTPLMLSIVALAYQGRSAAEVWATGSLEQRRTHLFKNYTKKMFERRTKVTAYTPEQTLRWLSWLARSLMHNNLSVFYLEWMQPDWLPSRAQRWIMAMVPIMFSGLILALGGVLVVVLFGTQSVTVLQSVTVGLGMLAGLGVGLGVGGFLGLIGGLGFVVYRLIVGVTDRITPAEALRWSWRRARQYSIGGLILGLSIGLPDGLGMALSMGLIYALISGLIGGLTPSQIVAPTIPNEGIRQSLRNALISFLTGGLIGLIFGPLIWLASGELGGGVAVGLAYALSIGLLGGLVNGGSAYLKHRVLRILLWRNNYASWNYIRFLDYAAERVFLRKVGGGYIFIHRLLMEYFATLQPTDQAGQAKTE